MIYAQFSDSSLKKVISIFGCPQDPNVFPNQFAIEDTDARYRAFIDPQSTVDGAKEAQVRILYASYQADISKDVAFKSASNKSKTYQADQRSIANLQSSILGCLSSQETPKDFYWLSSDNTAVLFSYDDLKGLASAIFQRASSSFQKLQELKKEVADADDIEKIKSIVW